MRVKSQTERKPWLLPQTLAAPLGWTFPNTWKRKSPEGESSPSGLFGPILSSEAMHSPSELGREK